MLMTPLNILETVFASLGYGVKKTIRFWSQMTLVEFLIQHLKSVWLWWSHDLSDLIPFFYKSVSTWENGGRIKYLAKYHAKVPCELINAHIHTYKSPYVHFKCSWPFFMVPNSLCCEEDKVNDMCIWKYTYESTKHRRGLDDEEGWVMHLWGDTFQAEGAASAMTLWKERVCMYQEKQNDWYGLSIGIRDKSDI